MKNLKKQSVLHLGKTRIVRLESDDMIKVRGGNLNKRSFTVVISSRPCMSTDN